MQRAQTQRADERGSRCENVGRRWLQVCGPTGGLGILCGLLATRTADSPWATAPLSWVDGLWRHALRAETDGERTRELIALLLLATLAASVLLLGIGRRSRIAGALGVAHLWRGPGLLHGYVSAWVAYRWVECLLSTRGSVYGPIACLLAPLADLRRHGLFSWLIGAMFLLVSLAMGVCWCLRIAKRAQAAAAFRTTLERCAEKADQVQPRLEDIDALWKWARSHEGEGQSELGPESDRTGATALALDLVKRLKYRSGRRTSASGGEDGAEHQASHLLLGRFGSGKSTVGEWVRSALEDDRTFAWCSLSAWPHTSGESLIRAIVERIEHAVERHDSAFIFRRLGQHYLSAIGSASPGLLTPLLPWRRQREPQDIISSIDAVLSRLNLRLVVWFDDLGRFDAAHDGDEASGAAVAQTETLSALRGLLDALNRAQNMSVVVATESATILARDYDRLFPDPPMELPAFSDAWAERVGALIEAELWSKHVQPFPEAPEPLPLESASDGGWLRKSEAAAHPSPSAQLGLFEPTPAAYDASAQPPVSTQGTQRETPPPPEPPFEPTKEAFALPPLRPPAAGETTLPWNIFVRVAPYPRAMKRALQRIRERLALVGYGLYPGDIVALSVLQAAHPLLVRDLLNRDLLTEWSRTCRELEQPIIQYIEQHDEECLESSALAQLESIRTFCADRLREPEARASADILTWLLDLPNWPVEKQAPMRSTSESCISVLQEPLVATVITERQRPVEQMKALISYAAFAKHSNDRDTLVQALRDRYLPEVKGASVPHESRLTEALAHHIETTLIPGAFLEVCDVMMLDALEAAGRNDEEGFALILKQCVDERIRPFLSRALIAYRSHSPGSTSDYQAVKAIVAKLDDARVAACLPFAALALEHLYRISSSFEDRFGPDDSSILKIISLLIARVTAAVESGTFVLSASKDGTSRTRETDYLIFECNRSNGTATVREACLELAAAYARAVKRDAVSGWERGSDALLYPLWSAATESRFDGSRSFSEAALRKYVTVNGVCNQKVMSLILDTLARCKPRPVSERTWRSSLDDQFERLASELRDQMPS